MVKISKIVSVLVYLFSSILCCKTFECLLSTQFVFHFKQMNMIQTAIEIIDFKPEYASYFEQYNKAWIQEHYELEPQDLYVLEHP